MKSRDEVLDNICNFLVDKYQSNLTKYQEMTLDNQTSKLKKMAERYGDFYLEDIGEDYESFKEEVNQAIYDMVMAYDEMPLDVFEDEHEPWLEEYRDKISWKMSNRYTTYLLSDKKWDLSTVSKINKASDIILDHCGNPLGKSNFTIKGLVVGDIQSGKTANYTALINKAIDAGYIFIIVLAGMTNDLRSQTQKRLDKEVIGYQSLKMYEKGRSIGVGNVKNSKPVIIDCLTDANLDGDIRNIKFTYSLDRKNPLMIVIKKNGSKLDALIKFIQENPAFNTKDGKISTPTLIIDDEADQASLNTNDKQAVEDATSINRKIRTVISFLKKYSYVGYTATPFANSFVNPFLDSSIPEEDKDVFPEDFIITLKTPDNYSGVTDFFGNRKYEDEYADGDSFNLDLFSPITDKEVNSAFGSSEFKAKVNSIAIELPASLKDALMRFVIVCAVKMSRGFNGHSSMLIHLSHFVDPNLSVKPLVIKELSNLARRFAYLNGEDVFHEYWENYIKPISQKRLGNNFNDNWDDISEQIDNVFSLLARDESVVVVGGKSDDILDYDSAKEGIHVVIGGNKLSRGLTLEGLIVSYYYRNARAYDTLLQMGRWFGYREGWLDLCKIYTTKQILNDFISSAEALDSFKKDITVMNKLNFTPKQFGLKVATSPKLTPTSRNKMRHTSKTKVSFSGDLQQTISFDPNGREHNRQITLDFLKGKAYTKNENGNYVFRDVDSKEVIEYLSKYRESLGENNRISVAAWNEYIKQMQEVDELKKWTIVLHSLKTLKEYNSQEQFGEFNIIKPRRKNRQEMLSNKDNFNEDGTFKQLGIKVITNPADFMNFYEDGDPIKKMHKQYDAADDDIRNTFTPENGLLTIYDIDITDCNEDINSRKVYPSGEGIIGLGLWFPISEHIELSAEYYVNEVYQAHGGKELDSFREDDDE